MTGTTLVVAPFRAVPAHLADVRSALHQLRLPYRIEQEPDGLWDRAGDDPPPVVVALGVAASSMMRFARRLPAPPARGTRMLALVHDLMEAQETALLGAGAHDVLGLPASPARLQARLAALARHGAQLSPEAVDLVTRGDLAIHVGRREVRIGRQEISLTKTEFDLLVSLAQRPRQVLSRNELTTAVMGHDHMGSRALESHLSRLRTKIRLAGGPRLVEPVRGVGYRLGVG